jgi:hypothetical protein
MQPISTRNLFLDTVTVEQSNISLAKWNPVPRLKHVIRSIAISYIVTSCITSAFIDGSLAKYSTVNRSWNSVIEALTFRELRSESLDHLQQIPGHMDSDRWAALRSIDIIIQLPEYGKDRWYEFESEHEKDTNNIVFSDSLREVFDILNAWQEYKGDHAHLTLAIQAISKSDSWHLGNIDRIRRRRRCTSHGEWLLELATGDSEVEREQSENRRYDLLSIHRKQSELPARIHYPEISFRTAVNRDILDDLYLAAARAVARMPNLRDLQLTVGDEDSGCVCRLPSNGRCTHRLVWISKSQTAYEPHPDVMKAWKAVFADRLGELDVPILCHEHYPMPPV